MCDSRGEWMGSAQAKLGRRGRDVFEDGFGRTEGIGSVGSVRFDGRSGSVREVGGGGDAGRFILFYFY